MGEYDGEGEKAGLRIGSCMGLGLSEKNGRERLPTAILCVK